MPAVAAAPVDIVATPLARAAVRPVLELRDRLLGRPPPLFRIAGLGDVGRDLCDCARDQLLRCLRFGLGLPISSNIFRLRLYRNGQ